MRKALVPGSVLLICICIAGSAQPVFAQDNQRHAGVCRDENCPCDEQQKKDGMVDTEAGCMSPCDAERKSLIDQGNGLSDLEGDFQDDPKMLQVIYHEYLALVQRWNALKKSCPSVTGDFPFLFHPEKAPPAFEGGKPDPKEAIDSDPWGNAIAGTIGGAVGGATLEGPFNAALEGTLGDYLQNGLVSSTLQGGAMGAALEYGEHRFSEPAQVPGGSGDDSKNPETLRTKNKMVKARASEVMAVNSYLKANQGYRAAMVAKDAAEIDATLHTALAALVTAKEQGRRCGAYTA